MAMGDVIARLSVALDLQTVAFEKGATRSEKRANQLQRKFDKMGQKIGSLGQKMTIGLTAPLAAFGVSAFNAASDAAELDSAFSETFGNLSDSMRKWAEETGDAMGRSTQELQKAANTFGIFFNQAAPTREAAADMSKTFTVLAQDLASFYNVSESDALQKLRSGLSGEAEPLRDFGVFLSAAAVEAKGLEMGLGGLTGELSEQEKIMARYQLILESTKNAQGDVARTSDGTANQMRKAKAAFEELQVVVGTKLLPAITPLIEKLGVMLEWFTKLPDPVQEGTIVVAGIAAAMGPLLMVVGQLVTIIPLLSKALLFLFANPIILGIAAVVTGIYLAWKNWDKITAIVQRVYQGVKTWLQDKLGGVFSWVTDKVQKVEQGFAWLYDRVVGNSWIPDMVAEVGQHMSKLQGLMVDPATKATAETESRFANLSNRVQQIMDRLFPQLARLREYYADVAAIDADLKEGKLSEGEANAAKRALWEEYRGPITPTAGTVAAPASIDIEATERRLGKFSDITRDVADKTKTSTVRIAESFKDMAEKTVQSVRGLVDAIKGGGFLDILESAVGLFMNLAGSGVFGKGLQTKVNSVPGYATGTNSAARGWAWVGERGPELVKFRGGERVLNNSDSMKAGRGGGNTYNFSGNLMTPEFWAEIQRGDMAAAQGGAQLAGQQAMFQRSRRLA